MAHEFHESGLLIVLSFTVDICSLSCFAYSSFLLSRLDVLIVSLPSLDMNPIHFIC